MRYKRATKKQLVCAKGWYKVKCVLVYDLVTLGTTIFGGSKSSCAQFCTRSTVNFLSAREGKFVTVYRSSL